MRAGYDTTTQPGTGAVPGPELVACERDEDAQTEDEQQADDPSDHNGPKRPVGNGD